MEIRARYILIGLFILAAIVAGFGFVYWLNTTGGMAARTTYQVRFNGPVSGLLNGSLVLFNGLHVGEVVDLRLDPLEPRQVVATLAIDSRTPVRPDTEVGLEFRGLTGVPSITLTGGSGSPPPVASEPGGIPLLTASAAGSQDTMSAARVAIQHLDQILGDNAAPLKNAIANISTFSDALARNSDRLDRIVAGLEKMVGGEGDAGPPGNYGLTPPADYPSAPPLPEAQLVVADPTGLILVDTQRILVKSGGETKPAFDQARWSDTLPMLVQQTIVRSFENAGYLRVSKPADGLTANYQLLVDIRDFVVLDGPAPSAGVAFAAKILDESGAIIGARIFSAAVPVTAMEAGAAASALDSAFGKVTTELVVWTLDVMNSSAAAPPSDKSLDEAPLDTGPTADGPSGTPPPELAPADGVQPDGAL